jgi:hypothetical protein
MKRSVRYILVLLATLLMSSSALASIRFIDDFESYSSPNNQPIGGDWRWYLTAWFDWPGCQDYWFGFGEPAPNSNDPYKASNIVQGATGQALNVFSDYANADLQGINQKGSTTCKDVSVFQEFPITAEDTGQYTFRFEVQVNEVLGDGVETNGFIKLLDPNNGYATVYYDTLDTTAAGEKFMTISLNQSDVGKLLQFGFTNRSDDVKPTSRVYDNVTFAIRGSGSYAGDTIGVPIPLWAFLAIAGLLAFVGGSKLRARKGS